MSGRRDPLATFVEGTIASGAAPGAAWWVGLPGGAIAQGAAGHAVIEPHPEPMREATPFDLASLTKPLATALLAVLLERERRMALDATLGSVFPELRASAYAHGTLRDAAAHRAGFPSWVPLYLRGSTREDYVRAIAATDRAAAAGATL